MQEYKCTVQQSDGKDIKGFLIKSVNDYDLAFKLKVKNLFLVSHETHE